MPTKGRKAKHAAGHHATQNIPSTMIAGESYGVSVSMKNIGSTTWMPTTLHNLGSQDPEDNEMWGMGRVVMPIASAAPATTVEFVWTVTAPLTPGSYAFQWEMVQDGVEHFGDFSPLVTVTVAASELGVPDGLLNAVWDSDNLLLELDGALSTTGRYTDSPGMWGGLVSEWQSAQLIDSWDAAGSSFYGYDSQNSTRLLTNASGVVTDNYAYRAFGTEWQSGNGSRNSYRYVGQYGYYRDSAAMQYVRARYLDVQAGRWVSRDPIRFGRNLYISNINNPIMLVDPSGLIPNYNNCPNNKPSCGPAIDLLLVKALNDVKNKFNRSSLFDKIAHCTSIFTQFTSAWDIVQLSNVSGDPNYSWIKNFPGCATPSKCKSTVSVNGECFHPFTVNYVLFGVICSLCDIEEWKMDSMVSAWKGLLGFKDLTGAIQWANAGYNGWPYGATTPSSALTTKCPSNCTLPVNLCDALQPRNSFTVNWLPNEPHELFYITCNHA